MTSIDTQQILAEGERIQWYRVERVLGRGGFGITYLATDTNLDHRVAIKEYLPGPLVERRADNTLVANTESSESQFRAGLQRFLREARTLVKFRHPNIVRVMAVFEANNTAYLVMEYEEGEQFKEYVKKGDGLAEPQLKSLILSVIDGLDQVHQDGFIHRDIKPVNLIIRKDGSPVLLDFGSTRPVENDAQGQHTSFVSAGYTPLEQYQEGAALPVGPWTDIYSLGATLYYAISGLTPVSPISRLAALVKKSKDPLRPAIQVGGDQYSPSFLQAIDWALGFRIEERPQSLSEWRAAFEQPPVVQNTADTANSHHTSSTPSVPLSTADQSVTTNRSKLLVRTPSASRKTAHRPVAKKNNSLKGAGAIIALCLLTVLSASWWHRTSQNQVVLDEKLERADLAFLSGDYLETARPLYLQILEDNPDNQRALSRIDQIKDRVAEKISGNLRAGEVDQAQQLIDQLAGFDDEAATAMSEQLSIRKQQLELEKQFSQIQSLIDQSSFGLALDNLSKLREKTQGSELRIEELELLARSKLKAEEARQVKVESDRLALEKSRQQDRQRVAAARERQRQRSRDYRRYLSSAEQALQVGEIPTARKWLDSAAALQINDDELEELESRVASAENFLQQPLSDYEIRYARNQFNALKLAIESKNQRAIKELTLVDGKRWGLFETLFDRYTQLSVRIIDVEAKLNPKRVTAVLRIEKMALANGDVVYPSSSYRDSNLSLQRNRYSWSAIGW